MTRKELRVYVTHVYRRSDSIGVPPSSNFVRRLSLLKHVKENDWSLCELHVSGEHTHTHTLTKILTFRVNMQLNLRGALQSYKDARHGRRQGLKDKSVNPNLN